MKIIEIIETAADSFQKTLHNKPTKTSKTFPLSKFAQSVKSGYKTTQDLQKNLKYGKVGKNMRNLGSFVKQIQKGPNR